jgi:hypothetical protein
MRRWMNLEVKGPCCSGAVLLAAVAFISLAGPATASDVFHACSKNSTGQLRSSSLLANATRACHSTETPRTWNQGFDSCGPQRFGLDVPANTYGLLTATCCPAEDFATGAGAIWTTPFERADNGPFYTYPLSGNTWTTRPYNNTSSSQSYALVLQCCGRQAVCGDGITECSEQCDPPGNMSQCSFSGFPTTCGSDCRCPIP